ncbi:MAG: trigger factor [Chloroflexi bacterium]|nr:trigger factor [Chloroflexota bacterium]
MRVTRDNVSPIEITLSVELETEDENPFLERSYRRTVSRINIPGFRRGKAPRSIVESMVGRTALLQEALDFMVPETLDKVLTDEDVSAFGEPSIEVTDLEPVSFTATVPLEPTIELGDYRSLRVDSEPVEIGEEQVDDVISRLQEEQAVWEPVERPAEYGDRLNLDVNGEIDGELVVDDHDVEYIPNEDNVLPFPGFAPNLVGLAEDAESEFNVTIPEDYPREQYAGKEVQFKVSVLSVKEKSVPELDDEFAKSVGEGFDDVEALRSSVRESLTNQAEAAAQNELEQKSLEALCEAAVVNASPILYERELEALQADRERMLRQQGLDLATYLRFMGKSNEEFLDEMRPSAERRLVGGLVLRKLAEAEEIEVTDEDIQSETDRLFDMSTGEEAEQESLDNLRQFLDSESTRDNIRSSLHSRRVLERLTEITQGKLDESDDDSSQEAPADETEEAPADETPEAEDATAAEPAADASDENETSA